MNNRLYRQNPTQDNWYRILFSETLQESTKLLLIMLSHEPLTEEKLADLLCEAVENNQYSVGHLVERGLCNVPVLTDACKRKLQYLTDANLISSIAKDNTWTYSIC